MFWEWSNLIEKDGTVFAAMGRCGATKQSRIVMAPMQKLELKEKQNKLWFQNNMVWSKGTF
jgi:hypothetical protein